MSGKTGYKLVGKGYVYGRDGSVWGNKPPGSFSSVGAINRGEINVSPDRPKKIHWFLIGNKYSIYCGGYAIFTWEGKDRAGNPIKLQERVNLLCP